MKWPSISHILSRNSETVVLSQETAVSYLETVFRQFFLCAGLGLEDVVFVITSRLIRKIDKCQPLTLLKGL